MVFRGTLQQLKELFSATPGTWYMQGSSHRFKSDKAHLDWWPSTGTIRIQGSPEGMAELSAVTDKLLSVQPKIEQPGKVVSMRNSSEYLYALDSEGVVWMMTIGTLTWTPLNKAAQ